MSTIDNSPEAQARRFAQSMNNQTLATALDQLSRYRGAERKAILAEAARRLRWRDAYNNTALV